MLCGDIQELCCIELLCISIKKTTLVVFKSNFIYCAMATFIVPVRFREKRAYGKISSARNSMLQHSKNKSKVWFY